MLVGFPPTFPQAVEKCVEKAEFYTGPGVKFRRNFQISHKTRLLGDFDLGILPVGMWKTKNQFCEKPKFSERYPHSSVESPAGFSTEIIPKNFHSDINYGPRSLENGHFVLFCPTEAGFPENIHRISPAEPQEPRRWLKKKRLSHNVNFIFHSFHPLYKYYCWYSYVFLGILSR